MSGECPAAARLRCANSKGASDECGRWWLWRWRSKDPGGSFQRGA